MKMNPDELGMLFAGIFGIVTAIIVGIVIF